MHPRYFLITILLVAVLVVSIGLMMAGFFLPSTIPQATPPYDTLEAEVESVEARVEVADPSSVVAEATATEMTSLQDAPSLLKEHCAGCHMVQLLERSRKSRTGWEKALAEMEEIGVYLNDTEKAVLFDYLTSLSKR